ncbi:cytochrome P450 [Trametes coccinea BRFM310]|uniref:Cytochrome P450 n=1 Tax=Trametes coccinea (strain BRFM310) TaxID=1353009 RepID=A0A1Y2IDD8_TRAC3|nr:cytochrome P450 [Trametes coccinea BRFM310]
MLPFPAFSSLSILLAILLLIAIVVHRRNGHLPPGPASGRALREALKYRPYSTFAQWSQRYSSPIVSFRLLWKRVIVINGFDAADSLLNKRSASFSDRPVRVIARLCGYDKALAFMQLGSRFKQSRKELHEALNARSIERQMSYFERLTPHLIASIFDGPVDIQEHLRFFFTKSILAWTLGYKADRSDNPLLTLSERVSSNARYIMSPSVKFWFELFPMSRFLPLWATGKGASTLLYGFRDDLSDLLAQSYQYVGKCLENGGPPSFLSSRLRSCKSDEETDVAMYAAVSLAGGAFDTMLSVVKTCLLAMILNPESQRKAQEEIDRVVGRRRLPTADDRPSLVFVEALFTEVLRWMPPIPLASRSIGQDEWYEDMLLPRDSTVIANIWAMTHDKSRFIEPDTFDPERYLRTRSPDAIGGITSPELRDIRRIVFGFGRRICPGQFMVDAFIWITITHILATMNISAVDEQNPPKPEIMEGSIIQFAPFPCKVTERFPGARDLVASHNLSGNDFILDEEPY